MLELDPDAEVRDGVEMESGTLGLYPVRRSLRSYSPKRFRKIRDRTADSPNTGLV